MITEELLMRKKSPNRIGTTYKDSFVKEAIQNKNSLSVFETAEEVDARFDETRVKSNVIYEAGNSHEPFPAATVSRSSVPLKYSLPFAVYSKNDNTLHADLEEPSARSESMKE